MRIHESTFWGIIFFLAGVFIVPSSSLSGITVITTLLIMIGGVVAYKKRSVRIRWFIGLMGLVIIGAMYWTGYNVHQKNKIVPLLGRQTTVLGHVKAVRRSEKSQQLIVRLDGQKGGTVSVTARPYPVLQYGDRIKATGRVKSPDEKSRTYLLKSGIFATMQFPEITVLKEHDGNRVMTWLLGIKQKSIAIYGRLLPANEAALLAGITLGERAEFSAEFKQQMANSGTTHLVALSGYNISVVAEAILLMCGVMMRRKAAFYVTLAAVGTFVVMAGAEASVVRAAIMGSIVLLASYIGRAHSMRNAIAVSACAMVLWNPNVLRYDLGFQLSFLALMGIVYMKPYIDAIIKRENAGILEWRENLSGTLSAQLMVAPVLMQAVGTFSWIALLSNILILMFIPVTMGLGFMTVALGFVAGPLAFIPAWIVSLLLKYEIAIIELLGSYKGVSMQMTALRVFVYYVIAGGIVLYLQKRKKTTVVPV